MKKALLLAALALYGCADRDPPAVPEANAIELRVMSFNIEWGGTHVSFDKVVEAVRLSNADIVGIQEAEGNLARLAETLGWHRDDRNYIISRYPLLSPPGTARRFSYVEVRPGEVVAIANVHLPSDPYGPYFVRDGVPAAEVVALEKRVRLPWLMPFLAALEPVVASGTPTFLTGDFNAPSHADRGPGDAVDWPVSRAVADAGFFDSWRAAYPDPATHPGFTWWAARPPLAAYTPGEADPQDRIDFVWFAGPAQTLSSQLLGEAGAYDVTLSVSPWPSDHRAVVSGFLVEPAPAPRLASASRWTYDPDDEVVVAYRDAADSEICVGDSGCRAVIGSGELRWPAGTFGTGRHVVELRTPGLDTLQNEFWVVDAGATPAVDVSAQTHHRGEPIVVAWQNGPGYRNDYLAVVAEHERAADPAADDSSAAWLYVDAQPAGSVRLDESTLPDAWPLSRGRYVVRLMKDDGYAILAESAPFDIL